MMYERSMRKAIFWGLLFMILGAFAVSACAAASVTRPVTLKDFSHVHELKTELEGALYKIALPSFVYAGLDRSQNHDLAVFNANGEVVPFVVAPASPVYDTSSALRSEVAVPFYELPAESEARTEGVGPMDIYVRTGRDGQVVEIKGGHASSASRDRRYFLDFAALVASISSANPNSHRLELLVPEDLELNAVVDIFQSENLFDWSPMLRSAPLIQLQNKGSHFSSKGFDLPQAPLRYLLLRLNDVNASFALKGVNYAFAAVQSRLIKDERETFAGTAAPDRRSVEYDTGGAFPVSKVNFVLQEPGFYKVRTSTRADPKGAWRPLGSMELSLIRETTSSSRSNIPANIDLREDRHWRIEFESPFSGVLPEMKVNWQASDVYFLAQGGSPYTLAFGSSRDDLRLQNSSFAQDSERRRGALEAEIGEPADVEKILASTAESESSGFFNRLEWQRYAVWVVLVLGALLLAGIALKLLKNGGSEGDGYK